MFENNPSNSFFQDNAVLDVVSDIAKDLTLYKSQISNNSFNSISLIESKLDNLHNYMRYVENRFSSETNSLYTNVKDQFEFIGNQFSNVMSAGSTMDTRVQNIEHRVNNLYEDLRKYETSINTRLAGLEEIRALYSRMDEQVLHINKQLEQLFYMVGKNEQKLDQVIFQKETLLSVKNPLDGNEQFLQDRNRKINEIYQNLRDNGNTDFPKFNQTKNNFDIKLENPGSQERKFEFNTFTKGSENQPKNLSRVDSTHTNSMFNSSHPAKLEKPKKPKESDTQIYSEKVTPAKNVT